MTNNVNELLDELKQQGYIREVNGKKGKIEEFLKSQSSIKSFDDLLNFVPDNERCKFLTNIKNNLNANENMINIIKINCEKLNKLVHESGSRCAALWVYALGDPKVHVTQTIRADEKKLYEQLMKYDECSTFVLGDKYRNEYQSNDPKNPKKLGKAALDYVAELKGQTDKNCVWTMPPENAKNVLQAVLSKKNYKERISTYEKQIGYPKDYLLKQKPKDFYLVTLDIGKVKKMQNIAEGVFTVILPNKAVPDANEMWVPGGFTSGGLQELVVFGLDSRFIKKADNYKF